AADRVFGAPELFDEDGIGLAQQFSVLVLDLAQDAHSKAWAGERMAIDHGRRQAQGDTQLSNFVLEQLAQRLEQLQIERIGQTTNIMMRFDGNSLARLGAGRFDHVRVDGALGQPAGVGQFAGFGLEYFNKFLANDLALLFGVGDAGQLAHELFGGIDVDDLHAEVITKGVHDLLGFVQAQEPVINKYAGQLVADGLMNERSRHRRIYTARQAQYDFVVPNLFTYGCHGLFDVVGHVPVACAAAYFVNETRKQGLALRGVCHFGMKLYAIEVALFVGHARNGTRIGRGHQLEAGGQFGDLVTVTHPHFQHAVTLGGAEVFYPFEQ